jgi:arylsulfatase
LSSSPRQRRETITFPDGGTTPFKGGKLTTWEGGMRAPMLIRWPGVIRPGTVKNEMFASLDWLPTFVNIAGGPKGDGLKKQIEAGQYPGIVKTTLDGVDQRDFLEGKSEKSARDTFFYYSRQGPFGRSGIRTGRCTSRWSPMRRWGLTGVIPYHGPRSVNIKRDPFETSLGEQQKTLKGLAELSQRPSTAYAYDWNLLPLGQALWLKELESYIPFPPLQNPASYNLEQVCSRLGDEDGQSHGPINSSDRGRSAMGAHACHRRRGD